MGERLTAGEVCTRSVTFALRHTGLTAAARLMRENHVGALVVVEERGGERIPVGMLTDRDIVTAVIAPALDPAGLTVGEVMSSDLVTVGEDESLIELMRAMGRKGVRRVPVVGAQGELIGLVTLDDVLAILAEELALLVSTIDSAEQRERRMRAAGA